MTFIHAVADIYVVRNGNCASYNNTKLSSKTSKEVSREHSFSNCKVANLSARIKAIIVLCLAITDLYLHIRVQKIAFQPLIAS